MTIEAVAPHHSLTDLDRAVLEFERTWWLGPGIKDDLIGSRLGLDPAGYAELLGSLVDHPDALAADPLVVKRLRRMRDRRRRSRSVDRSRDRSLDLRGS